MKPILPLILLLNIFFSVPVLAQSAHADFIEINDDLMVYIIIDDASAFFGLNQVSEIKQIGVYHHYLCGDEPWSASETINFSTPVTEMIIALFRPPTVRVSFIAETDQGMIWADINKWSANYEGEPLTPQEHDLEQWAWQFDLFSSVKNFLWY